jgi:hypothetical protein
MYSCNLPAGDQQALHWQRVVDHALPSGTLRNFAVGFERGVYSRLQIKSGGGGNPTVSTIEPLAREIQALIASPTRQKLKRLEDKLADMNIGKATAYLKSHTMEMFVQDGSLMVQRREWVKQAAVVLADVQKVLSGAEVGMSFAWDMLLLFLRNYFDGCSKYSSHSRIADW